MAKSKLSATPSIFNVAKQGSVLNNGNRVVVPSHIACPGSITRLLPVMNFCAPEKLPLIRILQLHSFEKEAVNSADSPLEKSTDVFEHLNGDNILKVPFKSCKLGPSMVLSSR